MKSLVREKLREGMWESTIVVKHMVLNFSDFNEFLFGKIRIVSNTKGTTATYHTLSSHNFTAR